jgi:hypothetical protein
VCFGGGGSTKPPPPQPPTTFDYSNQSGDSVQRQAAQYEKLGYTNTANYGSELGSGTQPQPSASPAATVPAATNKTRWP